ncbi:MAG: hypothetical protein LBV36_04765, partial [Chromatiales bacterium]|nr:hypothetical protein [Chromatiales bacterium]
MSAAYLPLCLPSARRCVARWASWFAVLLAALALALAGCGSDSTHPLTWQSSPAVGSLKDLSGNKPTPVTYEITTNASVGGSINPVRTTVVTGAT